LALGKKLYNGITKIPPFSLIEKGRQGIVAGAKAAANVATYLPRLGGVLGWNGIKGALRFPHYLFNRIFIDAPADIIAVLKQKSGIKDKDGNSIGFIGLLAAGIKGGVEGMFNWIGALGRGVVEQVGKYPVVAAAIGLTLIGTGWQIGPLATNFAELVQKAILYGIAHIP
jgi:hypothetical protein